MLSLFNQDLIAQMKSAKTAQILQPVQIGSSKHQNELVFFIKPELLEDADIDLLQDLITSGVNIALDKSRELASEKMSPFTNMLGGLGLGM